MVFYGFSRIQGRHGWFTGYEPEAAIFMSVFFIEISLITIGTEQDVRHPVRRSAHLLANHTQVNVRAAFDDIVIPVYIGGDMIDEIVVTAQQRMNLRSGGR